MYHLRCPVHACVMIQNGHNCFILASHVWYTVWALNAQVGAFDSREECAAVLRAAAAAGANAISGINGLSRWAGAGIGRV
jgi:hypothetical protein